MAMDTTPVRWPSADQEARAGRPEGPAGNLARIVREAGRGQGPTGPVCLDMPPGLVVGLQGRGAAVLECRGGEAWVTGENDGRDLVLRAGGRAEFPRGGRVVVTASMLGASVRLEWS